jgi:hypothetical protein
MAKHANRIAVTGCPPRQELIAYAAGLIEGEGYVVQSGTTARLGINMTDREPLERMVEIFGGVIIGPYSRPGQPAHHKPRYAWNLNGWNRVEAAHDELKRWLGPRRRSQFLAVLAAAPPPDRREPGWQNKTKTHCKHGHPYDDENTYVDSTGRRTCKTCRLAATRLYNNRHREEKRARDRATHLRRKAGR